MNGGISWESEFVLGVNGANVYVHVHVQFMFNLYNTGKLLRSRDDLYSELSEFWS